MGNVRSQQNKAINGSCVNLLLFNNSCVNFLHSLIIYFFIYVFLAGTTFEFDVKYRRAFNIMNKCSKYML